MDIRIVILRTITYSLVVIFISAIVVGVGLFIPRQIQNTTAQTIIAVAVSILLVIVLDPLKKLIGKVTDQLFFKAKINYIAIQRDLAEVINREIDLNKLTGLTEDKLTIDLKISHASVYVSPSKKGDFFIRSDRRHQGTEIKRDNALIQYLIESRRIVILESLERKIEDTTEESVRIPLEASKHELDLLGASIAAPVFVEQNVNAVIVLGHKLSGDPYSDEDINLLELLGPQLASAVVKSQLYDEIKQFNVKLQKEIDIATHDLQSANVQLQERNRFLSAIQKMTTLMTRSLDLQRVTQDIVDSISKEMGFLGGILLFLGKDRHKIFPEAITKSPLTNRVFTILEKPLSAYWGQYDTDDTRSIRAIRSGNVEIGGTLADFVSPPVPKEAADEIQRMLKIKTIIAVPIYSEGEVVGAIDYVLDTDSGSLKETDLQMMRALANQTGIVYKNIELYSRVEDSNKELGVANEHLKELDQAKSEFVSIASHQLRTPMTGIMGYLSMLVGGDFGKIKKDQFEIMQKLLEESQRMIRLIRIFLDVSKIESGKLVLKKAPAGINDIIVKAVDVLKKSAGDKGLKLVYDKPKTDLPDLPMDQDKISDVVMNLIDNAIKYTDKGSITVSAKIEGDHLHVWVIDTGIGIEPHEAKNLFNKFVRGYGIAQINPDGSGLGLYVARRLTEAHGGKIWVESAGKGKGSRFQFTLPLNPPKESEEMSTEEKLKYVRENR
ncbi:MAG: ATP-binding protein [Patescibacteria group bacterium]